MKSTHRAVAWSRWMAAAFVMLLALGAAFAAPASPAYALERRSSDTIAVPAGEIVDDDLFISGRSVRIDGRVRGDVFAFAQSITVNGVIEGDLIAAGAQVTLTGRVDGNVRAAGATVQLNGSVGRNVLTAAQLLQLGSNGRVTGNVVGTGNTFSLGGNVGGTVTAAGEDVELQGSIGRNAELALHSLTLGPQASIGGKLMYYAEEPANIPPGIVKGQVDFHQVQRRHAEHASLDRGFNVLGNLLSLAWLAGSAIVGILLLHFFPRFGAEFLGALETHPLPSLGLGLMALIGTIPLAVLVALTIVGIPIALLLLLGYFAGLLVGWLFLSLATGSILVGLARRGHPWHPSWAFVLGLLVLYVATRIPYVGGLVTFVGLAFGLGAFLITLYRSWRRAGLPPAPGTSSAGGPVTTAPLIF